MGRCRNCRDSCSDKAYYKITLFFQKKIWSELQIVNKFADVGKISVNIVN